MVQINISTGQGITQAIASHLGMDKNSCKKVGLSQWQQVMSLVDQNNTQNKAQNKPSIFSGGNDVQNINNKANWKTDFGVHPNQTIEIEENLWQKIKNILSFCTSKAVEETPKASKPQTAQTTAEDSPKPEESIQSTSTDAPVTTAKGADFKAFSQELSSSERPDLQKQFDVLGDDWRELANKKNKSEAEITRMQNEYQQGFLKFGESYMKHVDKTYGDGDGNLTEEEFVNSEISALPDEYKQDEEFTVMSKNAFTHIDINKDGIIDRKEMATFMSLQDMDVNNGGINGRIKAYDMQSISLNMMKPSTEEGGKAMDTRMKSMYKFLFGAKDE